MNALAIPVRQLTEQFTLREWLRLCAWVDENYGKTVAAAQQRGCWGLSQDAFFVGERKLEVKFDVLEIVRGWNKDKQEVLIRMYVENVGATSVML